VGCECEKSLKAEQFALLFDLFAVTEDNNAARGRGLNAFSHGHRQVILYR